MSDPSAGVRSGLQGRVNQNLDVLLKRFENIMTLAPMENKDRNTTAADQYHIECHVSMMVRAAEDLLALTRSLKEAWLFGQLGSEIGAEKVETEEDARAVANALRRMGCKEFGSNSGGVLSFME
ncbi:hypothetical protein RUND412_005766 [Rhizina undulata]